MNENKENTDTQNSRRSLRPRRFSARAIESAYMKKLKATMIVEESESSNESEEDEIDSFSEIEKPSVLNTGNTVVGEKLFSFQKRKVRNSLAEKVFQVKELIPKTPHHVRSKIKRKIEKNIQDSLSEHDFSDSGTEYAPTESSATSESSGDNSEQAVSDDEEEGTSEDDSKKQKPIRRRKPVATSSVANSIHKKKQNKKYFINTDDYFSNHSSKKVLTSNHTLDKLETPRLPQDQLKKIMGRVKLGNEHEKCLSNLDATNKSCFDKWLHLLHSNFNILLYGLGCKRQILKDFQEECLQNVPVIVVNGFFPTVTFKDILDSIIVDLLELKENPANPYEACELIREEFNCIPDKHLYIIVHNIEGEMLRNKKSQEVLARLATVRNIHLLASIDHINAPLIWDHSKLSKFNYSWWDVTSFEPYIEETSFENSLLIQGAGTLALSSLRNVFLSLTNNSKGIYLIIVKHQLENAKNQYYQGLAFKDLYWSCREAFLVSSDLALRAQLNEFVDHKMVKYKRSADGTEYLMIPIANVLLKKFLDEQSN